MDCYRVKITFILYTLSSFKMLWYLYEITMKTRKEHWEILLLYTMQITLVRDVCGENQKISNGW